MTSPASTSSAHRSPRPWWGLRREPGRLALAVFRMPLRAYNRHPERMPGRTFLKFVHTGRKTGLPHEAVAMVLQYDEDTHEAVICAAWGPSTDWVRNLRAAPAVTVQLGRDSFVGFPQYREGFLMPLPVGQR